MAIDPPREGGGPNPPFGEGFFQRVVNVHWKKAVPVGDCWFIFVSGAGLATPYDYWAVSAMSTNGSNWININPLIQASPPFSGNSSTAFTCAICKKPVRGFVPVILAGGYHVYGHSASGSEELFNDPFAAFSYDGGVTWVATSRFPLPATMGVQGLVTAVGYNEIDDRFYATVHWNDGVSVRILTFRHDAATWVSIDDVLFAGEVILAYPVETRVCDTLNAIGVGLFYHSSSGYNQVIHTGGHDIAVYAGAVDSITVDGRVVQVTDINQVKSVAADNGVILVGGLDIAGDSVHAMSMDDGAVWAPIHALTDVYGDGQGGGFASAFVGWCPRPVDPVTLHALFWGAGGGAGDTVTANFGASSFIGGVPSGFIEGLALTTFSPVDLSNAVLSDGDLKARVTSNAGGAVRSVAGFTSGKYYWEYTLTVIVTNGINIGIGTAGWDLTNFTWVGAAIVNRLGSIIINDFFVGALGLLNVGAVVGIAVDFTLDLIWFRVAPSGDWNGSSTADPATGAGGFSINALG